MLRRSASNRAPPRTYTVDAFDSIDDLRHLIDSDYGHHAAELGLQHDIENGADDFQLPAYDGREDDDELEDAVDSDDEIDELKDELKYSKSEHQIASPAGDLASEHVEPATAPLHVRGLREQPLSQRFDPTPQRLWPGPSPGDLKRAQQVLHKWAWEPTLPSRFSDDQGVGGFATSQYHPVRIQQADFDHGYQWWMKLGGKSNFTQGQKSTPLCTVDAKPYLHSQNLAHIDLLVGPRTTPSKFSLAPGDTMAMKAAWSQHLVNGAPVERNGVIINIGAPTSCLEWAPCHEQQRQYLLVAPLTSMAHDLETVNIPTQGTDTTANSTLEIWTFDSSDLDGMSSKKRPKRSLVIFTDWGDLRDAKWNPLAFVRDDSLGLLASVWTDGFLRVLQIPWPCTDGVDVVHLTRAAFERRPPKGHFTCVTWLGPCCLAAGCADGSVAIFDLTSTAHRDASDNAEAPTKFIPISNSHISAIASCYPSRPHIILTSSSSGYVCVTDWRDLQAASNTATVLSLRVRNGSHRLIWSDFAQSAITADDSCNIRGLPIRRFSAALVLGRLQHIPTTIAGSPNHPFLLVGSTAGEVISLNPLRRAKNTKQPVHQQVWFAHTWRTAAKSQEAIDDKIPSLPGLAKMVEGHKVVEVRLGHDIADPQSDKEHTQFTTVFEEKSAVSHLAWNPNEAFGAWAAAAMADGLLRVEDIALYPV